MFQCISVRAATIRVPLDYSTIQDAINASNPGDTILVSSGTYHERLSIQKPITLVGANVNTTIIDGSKLGEVIYITASGVTVSNFTIRNAGENAGISIYGSNNMISGNKLYSNKLGIVLFYATNNTLYDNSFFKTSVYGIRLYHSSGNKIFHNNIMVSVSAADDGTNTWDNGYPSGGNYWINYSGTDANGDGIGDTPYAIDSDTTDTYPLMHPHFPYGEFRDVGIINFSKSRKSVQSGETVGFNVTVFNYGTVTENIDITVRYDSTPIQIKTLSNLLRGAAATVVFTWNTSGVPNGKYTISAYATPLPNEADTTDNTYENGTVRIGPIPGDINHDDVVDVFDLVIVAAAFGSSTGDPNFNPDADINNDGTVDIFDLVKVAADFGETL